MAKKAKKFYEVTVCESFVRTFRVCAEDKYQATNIIENALDNDDAHCDEGNYDYNREITELVSVRKDEFVNTNDSEGFYSATPSPMVIYI